MGSEPTTIDELVKAAESHLEDAARALEHAALNGGVDGTGARLSCLHMAVEIGVSENDVRNDEIVARAKAFWEFVKG